MAITWRNVDAPQQSAANQLLAQGSNTLLSGFGEIQKMLAGKTAREKEQTQLGNEAILGALQTKVAGENASDTAQQLLQLGVSAGLDGKSLSALASNIDAQNKFNVENDLANEKLQESTRQFDKQFGLQSDEFGLNQDKFNQSKNVDEHKTKMDEAQLKITQEELGMRKRADESEADYKKRKLEAESKPDFDQLQSAGVAQLASSAAFKAMSYDDQIKELAAYGKAGKDAASILEQTSSGQFAKDSAGKDKAGNKYGDIQKIIDDPASQIDPEGKFKLNQALGKLKDLGASPELAAAMITGDSADYGGFWSYNLFGSADLPSYIINGMTDEDIRRVASENGLPLPPSLSTSPEEKAQIQAGLGWKPK